MGDFRSLDSGEHRRRLQTDQPEERSIPLAHDKLAIGLVGMAMIIAVGATGLFVARAHRGEAQESDAGYELQEASGQEYEEEPVTSSDISENATDASVVPVGEAPEDVSTGYMGEEAPVTANGAEPEAAEGERFSEQYDLFYEGYKVHRDFFVRSITSEAVISDAAVLIDADTGEVVAERDGSRVICPASMTKILTVLVAAEHISPSQLEDTVEITRAMTDYAFNGDCSIVGFEVGERPTVRDLFYGTILPSGADAALALAEYTAGSHEEFVALMNDKLSELGLSSTAHFTNCVGLYDDDHHCSLTDMAMILKAAVENDLCREVLSEHTYTTTSTPEHPDGISISNWFLRRIEDKDTHGEVICAKTGFVAESGCCAASYSEANDGHRFFLVTSGAWSSWRCIYDQVEIYSHFTGKGS